MCLPARRLLPTGTAIANAVAGRSNTRQSLQRQMRAGERYRESFKRHRLSGEFCAERADCRCAVLSGTGRRVRGCRAAASPTCAHAAVSAGGFVRCNIRVLVAARVTLTRRLE